MAHGSKKWIYAIDIAGGRVKRSRHRTREDKFGRQPRSRAGWYDWVWLSHAPKWFRRVIEKKYRALVRDLIVNERYDELPQRRPRDAGWNYW